MNIYKFPLISILLIVFINSNAQISDNPEITINELYGHISFLASDSLEGRGCGTEKGRIAAQYIASNFKDLQLKFPCDKGFQYFDVVTKVNAGLNNSLSFDSFKAQLNEDFIPFSFSENTSVKAEVVFAGYGFDFNTDSLSWNDYKNIDVSGKWVMILRGDPEIDSLYSSFIQFSEERSKVLTARDRGASGVLFVSGIEMDKKDELVSLFFDKSQSSAGLPVIHIKRSLANKILSKSGNSTPERKSLGRSIEELEILLNKNRKPYSYEIPLTLNASTEIIQTKVTTQNVIAICEGNHPELKNEYILIGAHYDHLGFGGSGSGSRAPDILAVHNGADDNASGVAAIIEIAEKLAANKDKLKRSIIFIAFGAEEMGLLGSKFFINNPLIDLKQIKLMLNFDMIGRMNPETKELTIGGSGTFSQADSILEKYSKQTDLKLLLLPEGYGPSDHAVFYSENIPVLYFFTGTHDDYHTPNDDVEYINFEGEKAIADFAYDLIFDFVNSDISLTFKESGANSITKHRRRFKVTLGIIPDFASIEKKGLRVDGVRKWGPADIGGMKKGDIIIAIDGKPIKNIYDYMYRLAKLNSGDRISVEVLRDGKKEILIVQL